MRLSLFSSLVCALITATSPSFAATTPRFEAQDFGKNEDGAIKLFTLRNSHGMTVKIMTLGATMTEILVPDRHGVFTNVIMGSSSWDTYAKGFPGNASVIGRVANRIAKASFTLDGVEYKLAANNGRNHIHGGRKGFASVNWEGKEVSAGKNAAAVQFTYKSRDGEEGYPGNLTVMVTYTLTDKNELTLLYEATTDKATPINLTNHAYFNLAGTGDVLGQELWIAADKYAPTDEELIPTGEIKTVKGTPMDFTQFTAIGARWSQLPPKLNGYDHGYVLPPHNGSLILAARARDPVSGRAMELRTTEPGVQLYTGNHVQHHGFCLETQHFPDAVHHPEFPSTILRPGQKYHHVASFTFSAK
ncbi:MAG TPA: aldose epimerase family protein [Verrucomicrobiae bacterium]|nr:aldose epimerase family protein [Verrucomicrobiae bacterium]